MMKQIYWMALSIMMVLALSSCGVTAGAGGVNTGVGVSVSGSSTNYYDLVPIGDRITYTIDISTPEGKQKLDGISLADAQRLAETEAIRKYNCDRLIDPRFDYLKKGKRILRITVDGRPGNYRTKETYDAKTRQEIDINVRH